MTELLQTKESLVKLLLSAPSQVQSTTNLSLSNNCHQSGHETGVSDVTDVGVTRLINYFQQSSGSTEKEPDLVMLDHNYCRPWNWRPETSYMRPTKCLFVWRGGGSATQGKMVAIDVTGGTSLEPAPVYDVDKARLLMDESEQTVATIRPLANDNCEDWENRVPRASWNTMQGRLFSDIIKVLDEDRLGRLTYEGLWNEPVLRRNVIDKSVSRARSLFAGISWDVKLTQWLHGALLDHLPRTYLVAYLDLLQSLRTKLPALVDRMLWGRGPTLRRSWEPGAPLARARPPPQLPSPQPVFVFAPCGGPRTQRWAALLAQLGPVVQVQMPTQVGAVPDSLPATADRALAAMRARIAETRTGDRPVVLVGAGAGASLALQAADAERVVCCLCLGPALLTAEGRRGEPDDAALLDAPCPVLLVVGQCAHRCTRELAEDIRERMRVRTGLVIVGSADDHLRMAKSRRRRHGVTQAIVDRCVLDEIAEFVGGVLSVPQQPTQQMPVSQQQQSPVPPPPPPPPVKISRPVGRPPGSGRKKHILPPLPSLQRPRHHLPPPPLPSYPPIPPPPWYLHRHATKHRHTRRPLAVLQQQKPTTALAPTGQIVLSSREQRTAVKVLDGSTAHGRRTVDLSKVTLVNTAATHLPQSQQHSVFVLADGTRCIRTSVPTSQQVTRLVPTRRQVTTNVRPTLQPVQSQQLTASDILDLPIIFADGDTPLLTDTPEQQPQQQHKFVLINKHGLPQQPAIKRTASIQPHMQPKYARIIINNSQQQSTQQHSAQAHHVQLEFVDLETELKTNTVPKPTQQPLVNDLD